MVADAVVDPSTEGARATAGLRTNASMAIKAGTVSSKQQTGKKQTESDLDHATDCFVSSKGLLCRSVPTYIYPAT